MRSIAPSQRASQRKGLMITLIISTIVDEVAGKELYNFMDGYSGYNQVSIAPKDYHKTTFTSPWGTFVYIVMPFGLCNASATFQRIMTYAFSKLFRKINGCVH
jgi:hypothetical protein